MEYGGSEARGVRIKTGRSDDVVRNSDEGSSTLQFCSELCA